MLPPRKWLAAVQIVTYRKEQSGAECQDAPDGSILDHSGKDPHRDQRYLLNISLAATANPILRVVNLSKLGSGLQTMI